MTRSRLRSLADALPRWALAAGPMLAVGVVIAVLVVTSPFGDLASTGDADAHSVFLTIGIIGIVAGVVPVAIGMLWFPFIRSLDPRWLHGFLALSAGVLAFVGLEMIREVVAVQTASPSVGGAAAAVVAAAGTFGIVHAASRWRMGTMATADGRNGLRVAYLVAVALGLHSLGEGMAIGSAFVRGDGVLVTLLVVGFVMHNVTEGPTVVAAVARDETAPPLYHFAAMGALAGGTVIVGGWIGSLAQSTLLETVFYAVGVGAIAQVLWEVGRLIQFDAGAVATRLNAATFSVGVGLMFVLEELVVG